MIDAVLANFAWNLEYARELVADLTDEECRESGGPGLENHPAWTLGHLVTGVNLHARGLGLPDDLPEGWRDLFERRGPGDPRLPSQQHALYPSRDELLAELARQHDRVNTAWGDVSPTEWNRREDWAFGRELPTFAAGAVFMLLTHEALHLGQLAAWRRARGLPSALERLARRA